MNDIDPTQPAGSDDPAPPLFAQPLASDAETSAPQAERAEPAVPAPAQPVVEDTTVDVTDPSVVDASMAPPASPSDAAAVTAADAHPEAEAETVDAAASLPDVESIGPADSPPAADTAEPEAAEVSPPEVEIAPDPLVEFAARLASLETAVSGFARRDESGRAAINALHSELGDYKDDFLVRAQAPMLRAMVRMLDDIDGMVTNDPPVTSEDLAYLSDQVVEVLESYGAEEVMEQPEIVDGAFQKVLRTEPTDDPAQHRRVAAILRRGWRAHGRLLRPQNVSVYVCNEPDAGEAVAEPEDDTPPPTVVSDPASEESPPSAVEAVALPPAVPSEPATDGDAGGAPPPDVHRESTTDDGAGDGQIVEKEPTDV